ncbi:MAG: PEP-CTERM system histidine kinase PrsK [Proteobacteria bacterium]|nr:MAG: PEP-CTERM system histidine kinase PrsK [Pseudomonadota bacterium]
MMINFSTISHSVGALAFALVSLLIFKGYLRRTIDSALLVATVISTVWSGMIALQSHTGHPPFEIRYSTEILRNLCWAFVVISIVIFKRNSEIRKKQLFHNIKLAVIVFYLAIFIALLYEALSGIGFLEGKSLLALQIASSVLGLIMVEQAWRNASTYGRSNVRYLFIAIGGMFAYDFFLYSDALLFGHIDNAFWDARGLVNALVIPLIAITTMNSHKQPVAVQVSRQMVFHTGTLFLAGVYLLIISFGGYYIKVFGGTWGEALRAIFLFGALLVMLILLSSNVVRARLMLFISKNFFDYKYDYREEWLKSINLLMDSSNQAPLEQRVISVLASLVESNKGALWLTNENQDLVAESFLNNKPVKHSQIESGSEIVDFFKRNNWIIDLRQYAADPTKYNYLEIPECITRLDEPWIIVPIYNQGALYGFVVIGESITQVEMNWENFDIIKVVANQACSFLAQNNYQEKLAQAKQFEAVNRTSAFMVHDIKTIIAQLSLLTKNAHKFKNNPAFIEDMIKTTEHTVDKMQYLLQQIRNPGIQQQLKSVELVQMLEKLVTHHSKSKPEPKFECSEKSIKVRADEEQLFTVIGHIVQNAKDATPKNGDVTISLRKSKGMAYIFIQDSGTGMSEDFMKNQLFKPFVSTKGLTGMGIGAYQCQEYLRKLGGNIEVTSQEDIGSCFTLHIPIEDRTT